MCFRYAYYYVVDVGSIELICEFSYCDIRVDKDANVTSSSSTLSLNNASKQGRNIPSVLVKVNGETTTSHGGQNCIISELALVYCPSKSRYCS